MCDRYQRDSVVFKAFCNEYRLQILERLSTGEKCACDLQEHLDISQSTLSHHMNSPLGFYRLRAHFYFSASSQRYDERASSC